jgi:hypothetical protein
MLLSSLMPGHALCRERQRLRREARRGKDAATAALAAEAEKPPVSAVALPSALGAVSEAFADSLADYLEDNPEKLLKDKVGGCLCST